MESTTINTNTSAETTEGTSNSNYSIKQLGKFAVLATVGALGATSLYHHVTGTDNTVTTGKDLSKWTPQQATTTAMPAVPSQAIEPASEVVLNPESRAATSPSPLNFNLVSQLVSAALPLSSPAIAASLKKGNEDATALSVGAIIGIAVGGVAATILTAAGLVYGVRKCTRKNKDADQEMDSETSSRNGNFTSHNNGPRSEMGNAYEQNAYAIHGAQGGSSAMYMPQGMGYQPSYAYQGYPLTEARSPLCWPTPAPSPMCQPYQQQAQPYTHLGV